MTRVIRIGAAALGLFLSCVSGASAQDVTKFIVEIRTRDVTFAGTDDPIQLSLGGQSFHLDDPDRDDFERDNNDHFELDVPGGRMNVELIRAVGLITVSKLGDSFFGGGWAFGGITVWVNSQTGTPIYQNDSVNKWLDGSDLTWTATLDDPGWSFPPPAPPFPPCTIGDVDTGLLIDSDCDGISDDSDDTFNPTDTDGDGLPDLYETNTGTDPTNPDSDGDGWWEGGNRRAFLLLTRIKCFDEEEDIGSDEIYVVSEEVRYPLASALDGSWPMDDGAEIFPGVVVDTRVSAGSAPAGSVTYHTRLRLKEGDPTIAEGPTDDTYKTFDIDWNETENTFTIEHQTDDAHYVLEFRSFSVPFRDPNPMMMDADSDGDGLTERDEFLISAQDPAKQPTVIAGYHGLADPVWRDLFVEIDAVGSGNRVPYMARQMVVSQFQNQNITARIDAAPDDGPSDAVGHLGGGQTLTYEETLTLPKLVGPTYKGNPMVFAPARRNHFRYGLFSDRVEGEGSYGVGSFEPRNGGFVVAHFRALADFGHTMLFEYTPILIMHEMGHTFNLCHRAGDRGETAPDTCPATTRCQRYCSISSTEFVDQSTNTAMGSDTLYDLIIELGVASVVAAAAGTLIGIAIGAAIGGLPGAIIGGIIGGLAGLGLAVSQADVYQRVVDYHPIEWKALVFW